MKFRTLLSSAMACGAFALATAAVAQTTPASSTPMVEGGANTKGEANDMALTDKDFMEKAAHSGHTEIEGSKLAQTHSKSADVKAFADQMIKDHTKVGEELAALAKTKGYDLPKEPSLMQKAVLKTLDMRDESFDKKYADQIGVTAHEDAVKLFERATTEAKDPDVKQFAVKTLPALQHHLEMAKTLQQKVGAAK